MNSLSRRLIGMVGCLGFWTMMSLCLGLGYGTVTGKTSLADAAAKSTGEGGKIVLTKLSTGTAAVYSPSSGKLQYQLASTAKTKSHHSRIKHVQQAASNPSKSQAAEAHPATRPEVPIQNPAESVPAATTASTYSANIHRNEPSEIQRPAISEEPLPSQPTSRPGENRSELPRMIAAAAPRELPEMSDRSEFQQDDTASPVRRKIEKIPAESANPVSESASQAYPLQETMEIIARSLLKFSLIIACCLSLYFSYSALQIAKSAQKARRANASGSTR